MFMSESESLKTNPELLQHQNQSKSKSDNWLSWSIQKTLTKVEWGRDFQVGQGKLAGIRERKSIDDCTPAEERARQGAELQDLYAAGKHAEILAAVGACLPRDEAGSFMAERERSDVAHDLLAFLAERMLEMNRSKQQEIRGFLGWLEDFMGAKVEDLTTKTRLQGYYEHDFVMAAIFERGEHQSGR